MIELRSSNRRKDDKSCFRVQTENSLLTGCPFWDDLIRRVDQVSTERPVVLLPQTHCRARTEGRADAQKWRALAQDTGSHARRTLQCSIMDHFPLLQLIMKPLSFLCWSTGVFAIAASCSCSTTAKVDPEAKTLLVRSTDKLRAAHTITASGRLVIDPQLLPPGSNQQKVDFKMMAARPANLAVTSIDGSKRRLIAGHGKISLYDEKANAYTSVPAKARSMDELVDQVEDEFDIKTVIGEMLGDNPIATLMEGVTSVKLMGQEEISGVLCDKLCFTQKDLSWALWIARSDVLPRKTVITYDHKPGHPQRNVVISKWQLDGKLGPEVFDFQPPRGAQQVGVIH